MAARLPINELPFEKDTETSEYVLPNGDTATLTKRQYFDVCMGDWYEKYNQLAAVKASEAESRARLTQLIYPDQWDVDGTDKYELPGGWVLEIKRTLNDKIDEAALPAIREEISKLPPNPETGELATLEGVIRMKPDFSLSGYRNMRDDVKAILNECLTLTPGTPGYKLIPPSAKATQRASDQKARGKQNAEN